MSEILEGINNMHLLPLILFQTGNNQLFSPCQISFTDFAFI